MFTAFQKPITRWGSKRALQFENSWYGCSGSESIQVGKTMSSEQSKKSVYIGKYVPYKGRFFSEMMHFSHCPKNVLETILEKRF